MKAFHFGEPATPLFGCLHQADVSGGVGAVLCPPILHEYMAAHRMLRQLAVRLAQAGIDALRFDYFGAGDSAGDSGEGDPERWRADLDRACAELSNRLAGANASLIGVRYGATLALRRQTSPAAPEVPCLVLWDPVLDGTAYVDELSTVQRERFGPGANEVLGFPFGPSLRAALSTPVLDREMDLRARRVLVVEHAPGDPRVAAWVQEARQRRAVEHRIVPGSPIWHEPGKMSVPAQAVQAVVSWIKENV